MTTITSIITTIIMPTRCSQAGAPRRPASSPKDEIEHILEELDNSEKYGMILRAKGIVAGRDGEWIHFDYVPEETSVRNGSAGATCRLRVIGSHINEAAIEALFA